jgi:hypothetical protein
MTGYSEHSWNGPGGKTPLNAFSESQYQYEPGVYDIFVLKLTD